jgi:NADPH:quinone reductase-like Zn-dependent oxidoreductase
VRAVVIEQTDGGTTFKVAQVAEPDLGPEQVRIAVRAASVNRADLAQRAGTHGPPPGAANGPVVPGLDAAGDVVAVGDRVEGVKPGDRVMILVSGGLAERVVVDAGLVVPIPEQWSYVEGAAAIMGLLTEHNALRTVGRLQAGETVLVHAAASGVGLIGVRLAAHFGAGMVIGTTRSGRGRETVLAHGADHIVQPQNGLFATEVLEATGGRGVDVIVDHVGGRYLEENIHVAAVKARLVGVGRLGGAEGQLDMEALALKRIQITGVTFRTRTLEEKIEVVRALRADLNLDRAAAELRPVVDRIEPWTEIERLQAAMAADQHLGKMVLEVPAQHV